MSLRAALLGSEFPEDRPPLKQPRLPKATLEDAERMLRGGFLDVRHMPVIAAELGRLRALVRSLGGAP